MNLNTRLCTHSCANGLMKKHPILMPKFQKKQAHLEDFCSTSAEMSLKTGNNSNSYYFGSTPQKLILRYQPIFLIQIFSNCHCFVEIQYLSNMKISWARRLRKMKKKPSIWQSEKCLATLNSSVNSENYKLFMTQSYTGNCGLLYELFHILIIYSCMYVVRLNYQHSI